MICAAWGGLATILTLHKSLDVSPLAVVDGRQPFYSEGATFRELAELLIDQGAYVGMSMDGGGSSTMVIEGDNGMPRVLNSPIHLLIPGTERPVGTHVGIYVK